MEISSEIKCKKLLQYLKKCKSNNATGLISLIIPPSDKLINVNSLLSEEIGTASNVKNRVNRLSVLSAITSVQQKLKLYKNIPENGLAIFCGEISENKKIVLDFIPPKPLVSSLYRCDNVFHTEKIEEILKEDDIFGFIIMDGHGCLFGTLSGNHRKIIHSFNVDLPPKHGRGGQSKLRFERIREEKRRNYLRQITEHSTRLFITNDMPNIKGLIIGGSADFKTELASCNLFDSRLYKIILKIVDICYSGEQGFNQAIELSKDCLKNLKINEERKIITEFMKEIDSNTDLYTFGIEEIKYALELGAIKSLIIWDELPLNKNWKESKEEEETLLDDLLVSHSKFGCDLFVVSNQSAEGQQFCMGFGGIGGILRYRIDKNVNIDELIEDFDEFI